MSSSLFDSCRKTTLLILIALAGLSPASIFAQFNSPTGGPLTLQQMQMRANQSATFVPQGSDLYMYGFVDGSTFGKLQQATANGQIQRLVLHVVPGSDDDDSNLQLARSVRRMGLTTHIPSNGQVYSGGVDLFIAGIQRSVAPGGRVGVHPWQDGFGRKAQSGNKNRFDSNHAKFINYYEEMLGTDSRIGSRSAAEAFYWFTLDASPTPDPQDPTSDIHLMTTTELQRFGLVGATGRNNPNQPSQPTQPPAGQATTYVNTSSQPIQVALKQNPIFIVYTILPRGSWQNNVQQNVIFQTANGGRVTQQTTGGGTVSLGITGVKTLPPAGAAVYVNNTNQNVMITAKYNPSLVFQNLQPGQSWTNSSQLPVSFQLSAGQGQIQQKMSGNGQILLTTNGMPTLPPTSPNPTPTYVNQTNQIVQVALKQNPSFIVYNIRPGASWQNQFNQDVLFRLQFGNEKLQAKDTGNGRFEITTYRVSTPTPPQSSPLTGSWNEVRTDGRQIQMVIQSDGTYQQFENGSIRNGRISMTNGQIRIQESNGEVETFQFMMTPNRVKFYNMNGTPVNRFYWQKAY